MAREGVPERLIDIITDWILEGRAIDEILAACKDKGVKTPEKLVTQALSLIESRLETIPRQAWHIEARRHLYVKALEINDYKTCLDIIKDLARIENLYGKKKTVSQPAHDAEESYLEDVPGVM